MRYWDSSALVPLLVEDVHSEGARDLYLANPAVTTWWGSAIECASALARIERAGGLTLLRAATAFERLRAFEASWNTVEPSERIRDLARRLLRVHDLRAADSLQLAAALSASEEQPSGLEFVCFDQRLAAAAAREGFEILSSPRA